MSVFVQNCCENHRPPQNQSDSPPWGITGLQTWSRCFLDWTAAKRGHKEGEKGGGREVCREGHLAGGKSGQKGEGLEAKKRNPGEGSPVLQKQAEFGHWMCSSAHWVRAAGAPLLSRLVYWNSILTDFPDTNLCCCGVRSKTLKHLALLCWLKCRTASLPPSV